MLSPWIATNVNIRFDEQWNSEYNIEQLSKYHNNYFTCPSVRPKEQRSTYVAVSGPGTVWTEVNEGRLKEPYINCPEMIIIIETTEPKNYWAEPGDDASPEDVIRLFEADPGLKTNSKQSIFSKGHWPKHFIRADGSCGNFGEIKDVDELRRLLIVPDELLIKEQDQSSVDE